MIWQDMVISLASILFVYAMLPQITYGFKTKKGLMSIQFAIINIIAMIGLTAAYISFKLFFSIILNILIITLWLILLTQRLKYGCIKN